MKLKEIISVTGIIYPLKSRVWQETISAALDTAIADGTITKTGICREFNHDVVRSIAIGSLTDSPSYAELSWRIHEYAMDEAFKSLTDSPISYEGIFSDDRFRVRFGNELSTF